MSNAILPAALGVTALLGASLVWVRRADRQREARRQRLQAFAPAAAGPAGTGPSLARPAPRRAVGDVFLLSRMLTWLEAALAATGDRIGVVHLAVVAAAAAFLVLGVAGLLFALRGTFVGAAAGAAGLAAALLVVHLAQSRYRARFLNVFPDALDLLGRAVRAGLPVVDAMAVAGREIPDPVGPVFGRILDQTRIGVDIDEALQRTAERIRVPDFQFFVVAIALQRRTGGALAETLGNLSRIIRRRREVRLKARALSAEANASATVLGILPFFVGGVMYLLNRPLMSVLLTDPRGRLMLGLALLNLVMGVSMMFFIIRRTMR